MVTAITPLIELCEQKINKFSSHWYYRARESCFSTQLLKSGFSKRPSHPSSEWQEGKKGGPPSMFISFSTYFHLVVKFESSGKLLSRSPTLIVSLSVGVDIRRWAHLFKILIGQDEHLSI